MSETESSTGGDLAKSMSRGINADMSPEAILRRLEIVDELRELAKDLQSAKRLGPLESLDSVEAHSEPTSQNE